MLLSTMQKLIPSHQGRPSDDPIFALSKEAAERRARGESVVNATMGALLDDEGKLAILPTAARAIREVGEEDWAAYAPISGHPQFLRAVLDDLLGGEPDLRAAAIAVATPGGTGALRHAIANHLEPGQALLTTSFYWGPYQTLADEADRRVETFAMFAPQDASGPGGALARPGDSTLDLGALDAALARQVAAQGRVLLFLNDPCHNPTGYSMQPAEWDGVVERLLAYAARAPITLLVDTAYFAYNPRDPRAFLAHLRPLLGKVGLLFAWSASKTFTHYGLRVGALVACVADEAERRATEAALSYSCRGVWSNCSRGGQVAVTRLLVDDAARGACDRERRQLTDLLARRVAAWNELARPRGLSYPRYEGGFFVTVFADDAPARALRMKERGVFVVPSKNALRVALCSVAVRDVGRLVGAFG